MRCWVVVELFMICKIFLNSWPMMVFLANGQLSSSYYSTYYIQGLIYAYWALSLCLVKRPDEWENGRKSYVFLFTEMLVHLTNFVRTTLQLELNKPNSCEGNPKFNWELLQRWQPYSPWVNHNKGHQGAQETGAVAVWGRRPSRYTFCHSCCVILSERFTCRWER
jgi:hypothetical protein